MNIENIYESINNTQLSEIKGGLRNTCFIWDEQGKKYFIKKYNKDVMYSRHLSECRCKSEFYITQYLYINSCAVAKPICFDEYYQIGVYEYIKAKNLFDYGEIDSKLAYKVIEEISEIHKLPIKNTINGCRFVPIGKNDVYRYIFDGFAFLAELCQTESRFCISDMKVIAKYIAQSKCCWGNTQLHDGNILIDDYKKIFFCDFEKSFPNYPQLDLISFLKCRNLAVKKEKKLLEHYITYNKIREYKFFMEVYDLLFIINSLRILKKIYINEKRLKVVWIEKNGKRKKEFKETDSDIGLQWNKQRNETISSRIEGILNKSYSTNEYAQNMRECVYEMSKNKKLI